ncbi:hypothetical protein EC957_003867 [Mortierella hygrophila]|uniref:Uncharacterized protein n=1 Tax=Mortierella hygrophila TaxID=979708 RepID=A0A9P6F2A9_9FUNG|nr:hypothetical protein EC957_003867 [Mortierella hygrophila]
MMAGRLGLYGGVQQQTYGGDNLRRSQEIGRQDRSQDSLQSHDRRRDTILVPDVHVVTLMTAPMDKDEEKLLTVSAQDTDDNDNDAASVGSAPSPALSHSTPTYSAQSTTPSSPFLSGSPYPLDFQFTPGSRLPPVLSSSSTAAAVSFIPDTLDGATNTSDLLHNEPESTHLPLTSLDTRIPASATNLNSHTTPLSSLLEQKDEQDNNVEPHLITEENLDTGTTVAPESTEAAYQDAEGLLDEVVFEDEEDNSYETLEVIDKAQNVNTQETIEAESHPDGYGSLPKYSTYPTTTTTTVQQQHANIQDLSSSSSNSDAVMAELKEVRTILQDLHRRMDRLERSLQATSSSSESGPQKDKPSSPTKVDSEGNAVVVEGGLGNC